MKRILPLALLMLCVVCAARAETFPPTSTPTIAGIDVSAWQRVIDWTEVYKSGVRIAMIRASEGDNFTDPYLERNYAGAKAAGVAVGFYHFCTATTEAEAVAQADYFVSVVADKTPDCLLALDYGGGSKLSDETLTSCAMAFLARVEEKSGWGVMLYTDAWAAKARFGAELSKYPIWVANYGVTEPEANGKWSAWVGFQYSDRGSVSGIDGRVDLDQYTRQVYQGTSPTPTPTPTPVPGSETLYYETHQDASASSLASSLGTTQEQLRALNDLTDDKALTGQVVRYPSATASSKESFAGLHILQAKESLSTIASRYGTTVSALKTLNALSSSPPVGQVLRVPQYASRSDVAAPPSWIMENVVVVQSGQTMSTIASLHGIDLTTLLTVNGLSASDTIYRGQLIHLTAYGKGESTTFSGGYVVNQGDTLTRIASRFDTTAAVLYDLNNISTADLIYPGQVLLLPDK